LGGGQVDAREAVAKAFRWCEVSYERLLASEAAKDLGVVQHLDRAAEGWRKLADLLEGGERETERVSHLGPGSEEAPALLYLREAWEGTVGSQAARIRPWSWR
jgi:hypothetical protein